MTDRMAARIVAVCHRMLDDGLVVGTSGNVSARVPTPEGDEQIVITPTGVDYRELEPGHLPIVDLDGRQVSGDLLATSELPLHLAAYRTRPRARAVVHTHAVHATATSTLVTQVPNIHYMLAAAGGPVRVARYATYGTPELADAAAEALADRDACLLANHGTLAVHDSPERAYDLSAQLEWACRVWLAARAAGEPRLLDDAEIRRVAGKLHGYGQPDRTEGDPR